MIEIILIIVFAYQCALIDSEHIKKSQYIKDHRSRFYLRALFVLVLGQLDLKVTIGAALLFWALFDMILNSLMDWGVWYIGDTAKTDKFFRKYKFLYKTLKFICLVAGVLLMTI